MKSFMQNKSLYNCNEILRNLQWFIALLFLLAGFVGQTALRAAGEKLPKGEQVLEWYIKATGGKAAYDKINNRVIKFNLEIIGQGIEMSITVYTAKPNSVYSLVESDAFGTIERGVYKEVVWEKSLIQGPQIKEGQERLDGLRDAVMDKFVYWRQV